MDGGLLSLTHIWIQNNIGLLPNRQYKNCVTFGDQLILVGGYDQYYTYFSMETIQIKFMLPSWDNIKHFVLLRGLVDEDHAHPINVNNEIN